ncbi:MAG: glycoside hydrolase family 97 protein, partial [Pedobacter sp.]
WDETIFLDGYPGKFVVLARRHQDTWYIAAINAEKTEKEIDIALPMLTNKSLQVYSDGTNREPQLNKLLLNSTNHIKMKLLPDGGTVLIGK